MSNAKTGGNKKSSSLSDQNYWKRAKAGNLHEVNKERRIARHLRQSKTSKTKLAAANGLKTDISYPKVALKNQAERVTFNGTQPEMRTFDEHGNILSRPQMVIKNGVVTDVLRTKVQA